MPRRASIFGSRSAISSSQAGTLGAGNVDEVHFDLTAGLGTESGSGGPFAANGGVGDGVDGALAVTLRTNVAGVSITATGGNLTGPGGNIPFTDIDAADGGTVTVPDFGATVTPFVTAPGNMVDTWTYTYDNLNTYAPGAYTGTVTYSVTTL
jgi:hypothetical protein